VMSGQTILRTRHACDDRSSQFGQSADRFDPSERHLYEFGLLMISDVTPSSLSDESGRQRRRSRMSADPKLEEA